MKKVLSALVPVVAILIWLSLAAISDYKWHEVKINEKTKQGWVVVSKLNNLVDITHPWTIFKQPVIHVWFINNNIKNIDSSLSFVEILSVENEDFATTNENITYNIIDCTNKKYAYIKSKEYKLEDLYKLDWHAGNPGKTDSEIIEYVCKLKLKNRITQNEP